MKIVEVYWYDAQSGLDQISIKELKEFKLFKAKSIGYLVHKDKEKIILAFTFWAYIEEEIKHYQVIPMKMIKKIKEVEDESK